MEFGANAQALAVAQKMAALDPGDSYEKPAPPPISH